MVHETVTLLHGAYHPRNAVKVEKEGAFTLHSFEDGATLKVRTRFLPKLFSEKWTQLPLRSNQGGTFLFQTSSGKVIVRPAFPGYPKLEILASLLKHRARIESPILELNAPQSGSSLIVTRFYSGTRLQDVRSDLLNADINKIAILLAKKLARLHVAGYVHRHAHSKNILVHDGYPILIDPKRMHYAEPLHPTELKRCFQGILLNPPAFLHYTYDLENVHIAVNDQMPLAKIHAAYLEEYEKAWARRQVRDEREKVKLLKAKSK